MRRPCCPNCPVIMFTGTGTEEVAVEAMKAGLDDYIVKSPTHFARLASAVRTLLERTESRRRVMQLEMRLQSLLNHLNIGVFRATRGGEVIECNPALLRLLGVNSLQEAESADLRHLVRQDGRRAVNGPDGRLAPATELQLRRADGRAIWVSLHVSRAHEPDGEIITEGLVEDITCRKELEAELQRRAGQLVESDRRKDEFLATLAYELRNPLAPIRNALQIMRLAGDNPLAVERAKDMMERQLHHLVRLVDDLLDVSRITSGKIELRKVRLPLARIIESALETSRPLIEASGHELTVELPPEPLHLDADLTRLAQVIANLLNNSARYTQPGGHIWLTAEREGGEVAVRVRDNGTGIAADVLPHVFEMFTQADRSLERSQVGLGLGLTIVRKLVEMHGGTVEARSAGPGQGSEFTVRLPVAQESPPDESAVPTAAGKDGRAEKTFARRILVVEDNQDGAESLALLLRMMGHEVRTAPDGITALTLAEEYASEVVLLDIGLPKLNGYEVARRLRQRYGPEEVLLVAMTGYGKEEDRRRSQEAGFNAHWVKPVDPAALMQLLGELRPAKG